MSNWCWRKWGFRFVRIKNKLIKLPLVNPKKLNKLYHDIETRLCNPHDDDFDNWGGIISFTKANYKFASGLVKMLHWTTILGRCIMFFITFIWLMILSIPSFNWKLTRILN
jgi:hypothetical protein